MEKIQHLPQFGSEIIALGFCNRSHWYCSPTTSGQSQKPLVLGRIEQLLADPNVLKADNKLAHQQIINTNSRFFLQSKI